MIITFLGTGTSQGVPLIGCRCATCTSPDPRDKRLRTAVMVETQGKTLVIDTGPDFRQQMLRENVEKLDAVLLTHEHKDHLAGLDEVRAFNFLQKKSMPVYATQRVQEAIRREFAYIFETPQYPGIPKIDLHTISAHPFEAEGVPVEGIEVMHHQLPVLGFRIGGFVYITDANFISPAEKEKIRGCELLVLNALRHEKHISHFTLAEAIAMVRELKPRRALFTHISHQMGRHADIQQELPEGISIAFDGQKAELPE
ncbi:MAG TPA: MBL fold metallo-hydrolase [Bacteroidia bacterium]|nr:MBL fold metallo-hydrolase [Bacteroidia bacterium]